MSRCRTIEAVAARRGLIELGVRHGVNLLAAEHLPAEILQPEHGRDREGRLAAVARDHADLEEWSMQCSSYQPSAPQLSFKSHYRIIYTVFHPLVKALDWREGYEGV